MDDAGPERQSASRVSIVVPLYDKGPTIARSLASIGAQTFEDWDAVVVDDGSHDDGPAIAETFVGRRLRIVRQPNAGPGAARNRGVAETRGAYVAFLDADDEWLPDFLAAAVTVLDADPHCDAVTFGFVEGAGATSTEPLWRKRGIRDGSFRTTAASRADDIVLRLRYMNSWATVVRRASLARFGGFYEGHSTYGEDAYLWLKVLVAGCVALRTRPLAHWHSEASDLSRNLRGARPVEPLLTDPQGLYDATPPALRPLLDRVLAIRACKTAAMLGFWGDWQHGQKLIARFSTRATWPHRFALTGRLAATPAGALAGRAIRSLSARIPGIRIGSASWAEATDSQTLQGSNTDPENR